MDSFTEVYSWGSDQAGQLGLGGTIGKTYPTPRLCSFNVLIKEMSCGEEHTAFISNQGHVYTMGSNNEGRLGIDDNSVTFSSSPCLVSRLSDKNPVKIACGWGHTIAITESAEVFSWGVGEFGALGTGSIQSQWAPFKINVLPSFIASSVSCGSRHSALLGKNGTVLMAGCGKAGQLGNKKREQENYFIPIDVKNVVQVACGVFHTALLTSKGQVMATGGNSFGQLGFGNKKSTSSFEYVRSLEGVYVSKIACGYHSAAICDKGNLFIWGTGTFGEVLVPQKATLQGRVKDINIGGTFSVAYLEDRSAYAWGNNSNGELGLGDYESRSAPTLISSLRGKKISQIACGGNYCIALGNDVTGHTKTRHIRSQSKGESRKEEVFTHGKVEKFKIEEKIFDEKLRNERLRFDLDETTSQNIKLKNKSFSLENGLKSLEHENQKLREENSQLLIKIQELQRQGKDENTHLLIRLQETQKQYKDENLQLASKIQDFHSQGKEINLIREENLQLQARLNDMKLVREENSQLHLKLQDLQMQLKEINKLKDENQQLNFRIQEYHREIMTLKPLKDESLLLKRQAEDFEKCFKELDYNKKELNEERLKLKNTEKNFHLVSEENNKLIKQAEHLFNELSRVQKDSDHSIHLEKERLHSVISSKEQEIDKVSKSYHDLLIQFNRLVEENKIFRLNNSELEENNKKLFENLERELAARAHDYRERTLNILGAEKKSVSPIRGQSVSPVRKCETVSRTKLSDATQTKIGNTAARLLAKMENESALANLRISSPNRRSPERPVPYKSGVSREIREILRAKLQEYRD